MPEEESPHNEFGHGQHHLALLKSQLHLGPVLMLLVISIFLVPVLGGLSA